MTKNSKLVTIYTDGGCDPNPGPGGYGVVLIYGQVRKELSAGYQLTTNNRMELLAAIVALEALKEPCRVQLHSDSQYVVNGIKLGWAKNWESKQWKKGKTPNWELWSRLLDAAERHQLDMVWVRGHTGIPENERCDELATMAMKSPNLLIDHGYINPPEPHINTK